MSKVKEPAKPHTGEFLDVGTPVLILKGLWSKCSGEVESTNSKTGEHYIKILAKDGKQYPHHFHAHCAFEALDIFV